MKMNEINQFIKDNYLVVEGEQEFKGWIRVKSIIRMDLLSIKVNAKIND